MYYKQHDDQINLPIFMTNPEEIEYDSNSRYGIDGSDPSNNLFHDFFGVQRAAIMEYIERDEIPLFGNSFTIFYPSHPVIMYRRRDHEWAQYEELEDGNILMKVKTSYKVDPEIKHDTKLVWTPGTLLFTFNHQLDGKNLDDISSNEARIRNLAKYTIKQSVINCLNRKTGKKVWMNGNDILIENRKFSGGEAFDFNDYYHEHGTIQVVADQQLFETYLKGDKNHENSIKKRGIQLPEVNGEAGTESKGSIVGAYSGITGIQDEIPGYGRKEFAEDLLEEVNRYVEMLK